MNGKNLTGSIFKSRDGKEYIITAGKEKGEIAFEEIGNTDATLNFCCDALIFDGRLKGTYFVNYTVSKKEFFESIDGFSQKEKINAETIASALKRKYYKIPTVFLKLVGEMYVRENGDGN